MREKPTKTKIMGPSGWHEGYWYESEEMDAYLAQLENPWVSVEDRLPEIDSYVLAGKKDWGTAHKMHFSIHDGEQYWDSRNAKKHWMRDEVIPTHWKPLPEPPK